jgi:outer membrane protein TolC
MKNAIAFISLLFLAFEGRAQGADTLTFASAAALAMRQSPEMVRARMGLEQSRILYDAAKSALLFQLNLKLSPFTYSNDLQLTNTFNTWNTTRSTQSSGQLQLSQPILWTGGTLGLDGSLGWEDLYTSLFNRTSQSYDYRAAISYSQPLLIYNQRKADLRQQQLTFENARLSYAMKALSMEADIAGDYYSLYQNQMDFQIAREECNNARQSYEVAETGVNAGRAAKAELYQAAINLAQSQSGMDNKEVAWQNAAEAFKQRLGIPLDSEIVLAIDTSSPIVTIDLQKALSTGLQKRMELRQAAIAIENARADCLKTRSSSSVSGNLSASYGLAGNKGKWEGLFDTPAKSQNVSLSLQVPLWDFGAGRARVKASHVGLEQTRLSLDDEKAAIELAIRKECRSIQNVQTQISIARQALQYAVLTYDINFEKYRQGGLSALDLNQYQLQLSQAKSALIGAIVNYRIELLNMKTQCLWDFQTNEPVIPELSSNGE